MDDLADVGPTLGEERMFLNLRESVLCGDCIPLFELPEILTEKGDEIVRGEFGLGRIGIVVECAWPRIVIDTEHAATLGWSGEETDEVPRYREPELGVAGYGRPLLMERGEIIDRGRVETDTKGLIEYPLYLHEVRSDRWEIEVLSPFSNRDEY